MNITVFQTQIMTVQCWYSPLSKIQFQVKTLATSLSSRSNLRKYNAIKMTVYSHFTTNEIIQATAALFIAVFSMGDFVVFFTGVSVVITGQSFSVQFSVT